MTLPVVPSALTSAETPWRPWQHCLRTVRSCLPADWGPSFMDGDVYDPATDTFSPTQQH